MNKIFKKDIDTLPFIYKELYSPFNDKGIPNSLPFELQIDDVIGLLKQKPNDMVKINLEKAYRQGSIVGGVITDDSENIKYANDFIEFFLDSIERNLLKDMNILEIGSGTGLLLSQIKNYCHNVIGVEPGAHCLKAKEKYNVNVIHDFFPTNHIKGKFDVIIMSIVLEHFENPSSFLNLLSKYLNSDGLIILSVPDVEPFILSGDISMLFHEHYSYFTNKSLNNLIIKSGYRICNKSKSSYGGLLYRSISIEQKLELSEEDYKIAYKESNDFFVKSKEKLDSLKSFLNKIVEDDLSLGVYVPSRFLNILFTSKIEIKKLRFFDDNPEIKNKFYAGFDIKIENKVDLIKEPTDIVLIFSHSFGKIIRDNIINNLPNQTKIIVWEELFSNKELEKL
ncbi:class I SAM-dependent methyltransferase [Arcobacter caeni]|uniref:Methyltransferase type 12 n=1 Tax=Arcobacter caeni TaxID=1912877 RepID=A0A363CXD1_9BACT|nr:class I SAM-dependent methyltransferase [Arcobacter caeni]PUE63765.1 hypothetical protein B0174_09460 [Arcobacter caeni]